MAEECLTYNNMDIKLPCRLEDLPTPCLIVDEEVVAKNCRDMLAKAAAAGVSLRPHVKTHKCHQVGGNKTNGILASTLPEVRHMAADGFVDITYGVPVTASKVEALLKICVDFPATRISIFIDSEEQLREVESEIEAEIEPTCAFPTDTQASVQKHHGKVFGCFLKIDVGYHRAGVDVQQDPDTGVSLAQKLNASKLLDFRGVYSHSGNAYNASSAAQAKAISDLECSRAAEFAKGLEAALVPCPTISVGSTPSCAAADLFVGANEIHPGNYVFFDRQQMAIPVCNSQQVAVRVLTRVIGRYAAHYLCDTGSLAISKDLSPLDASYGQVEGSSLLLTAVSQECGKLQLPDTRPRCTTRTTASQLADAEDDDDVDDEDGADDEDVVSDASDGGDDGRSGSGMAVTEEVLREHFHLPLQSVAKKLGMCTTALKKVCRRLAIAKWPHRQLRGIHKKIAALKAELNLSTVDKDSARRNLVALEEEKARLSRVALRGGGSDVKPPAPSIAPDAHGSKRAQCGEPGGSGDSKRSKHSLPDSVAEPGALPFGTLLKIIPNHSCLTAACHRLYFVVRGDEVVDVWRPCHGW